MNNKKFKHDFDNNILKLKAIVGMLMTENDELEQFELINYGNRVFQEVESDWKKLVLPAQADSTISAEGI